MRILIILLLEVLYFTDVKSQETIEVDFLFNNENISLNKSYSFKNDSISFSKIMFYIGYEHHEEIVYQLLDIQNKTSLELPESVNNRSVFFIGVDSLTNVSGAMGGDLDPSKGMYWAWQSGFINVKIEGVYKGCKTRKNKFQYHLGGYQKPNVTFQEIILPTDKLSQINLNLTNFIKEAINNNWCEIMTPSNEAVQLSKTLTKGLNFIQ